MRSTRPRSRWATAVAIIATAAAVVSFAAVTSSASAAPPPKPKPGHSAQPKGQTSPRQASPHPTRQVCAAPTQRRHARCLSVIRTDVKAHKGVTPNDTPDGYGPGDLQSAYLLPSTSAGAGAGQTVAVVDAFDDPSAESDLAAYRQQYGLAPCTTANGCFSKVNQRGEQGNYPPADPGWAGEISLDVDMVSAVCPQCHILLVETDDNFNDNLGQGVNTAVTLGARYVSNSYGGGEGPDETTLDAYYDHPGVAVTASSGDDGYGASYPAASAKVTAVGGTSLTKDSSPRGWSEAAWAGAGSGCSQYETKPSFQSDPDCAMRSEADVSAVADPNTGVAVYNSYSDGGWAVYGGTSASAPIIAGSYALGGTPVSGTYPNSYPYAKTGSLYDVTTGSNGSCDDSYLCTAKPGYDGPTGLGTPNGVAAFHTGPHGSLTGTVTDSGTHHGVAGAKVKAGDASAITGADGKYTLSVDVGTYDVTASAYGYKSKTTNGVAVADGATVTDDFDLDSLPTVDVGGTVTDGSGHAWPLYAKITIDGMPGGPVYTDPYTGHYNLHLPVSTTYGMHVAPVYPGYKKTDVSLEVGTGDLTHDVSVLVDDATCTAPGYHFEYSRPIEHFDGASAPAGWTVVDNNKSGMVWQFDDPAGDGNHTGGLGNFAGVDGFGDDPDKAPDASLVSPVADLSNETAPVLDFSTDLEHFNDSVADVDLTIDGGTTWQNVWHQTGSASKPVEIPLTAAAGKSAVQVRFHYTTTFDQWWQVDDVLVGHKTCVKDNGGLVAGFATDGNTGAPVNGVTVSSKDKPAERGVSAATPNDGNLADGFYWLFSSLTGKHQFAAGKARYASTTKDVDVAANFVTRADYSLAAGRITVTPASVSATVNMGDAKSKNVKLTNTGTQPVHVKLGEQGGGFQIKGVPAQQAYRGVSGAPTKLVRGHFVPTRLAGTKTAKAATKPAATPSADPWQGIADYPIAISNNGVAYGDGKIYSVAGWDGGQDVATGYVYDSSSLAWTALPNLSDTREAPGAAFVNGKLYVIGGWGSDQNPTPKVEIYDPATNSWSTGADNPKPHAGTGIAVLDGKIYVVGGCNDDCGSTDVMVYDPAADSWSTAANYPEATSWLACGGISGQVYCAGGTAGSGSSKKAYGYDPGSDSWAPIADLPANVWGAGYAGANGQLLVSGGVQNDAGVSNQGYAYDPAGGSWTALPNSNSAYYRGGSACGFYKVGGSVGQGDSNKTAEVLPGYDDCGTQDVPWLSESKGELDLAPGASATVAVTMDSSVVDQPGTYTGKVSVGTDTPYTVPAVEASMIVNPPATWGKITGTVTGVPCSGSAAPLPGATVELDSWAASYTLTTDQNGSYALWLDNRNSPLTAIVAKDGWKPQTKQVTITAKKTTTVNWALKPKKNCG